MKPGSQKPQWVIDKERNRKVEAKETVWLFGLHAVRDALMNPAREKLTLVVTKNAADKLAEAIGGEGEVAAMIHDQTSATGIGRRDGFLNRIKEAYPKIEVVDVQYANDALKAADNVKAMLQANPDIKAIFASNEGSAIGLAVAIKETGAKIAGVGFDSGKGQKDAIMDGTLIGSITQNPVGIGQCVVDSLAKAVKGEELPKVIDTGFYWYDATNMADANIAAVLYD